MPAGAVRRCPPAPGSRREALRDGFLDRLGRGPRVLRVAHRPADHDVVGAVLERLGHVDHALLVPGVAADGTYSRGDKEKFLAISGPQRGNLQPGGNDAVAPELGRGARAL